MANEVRPGMRFRGSNTGHVYKALRPAFDVGAGWWSVLCETTGREEIGGLVNSNYEPIPEPAPELCAFPGCKESGFLAEGVHGHCLKGICACQGRRDNICCHPFISPQAKPVLREPKPLPGGLPDVCLKCRGDKGSCNYMCDQCWIGSQDRGEIADAWDALHRKPAAKDIPSLAADTEAARGGEAAITPPTTFRRTFREYAPSAVAAAPAIEPWRPTVDEWDLLPDAETGWRR